MKIELNAGVFVVLHFIGYSMLLGIFGFFYPTFVFLGELELLDKFLIRFFASYCYYGTAISFWRKFLFSSLLLGGILSFLCFKNPRHVKRFIFQWIGLYGMTHYLFWIFLENPKDSTSTPPISVTNNFSKDVLVFFALSVGLCLLFFVLTKIREKRVVSTVEPENIPSTSFECPYCHAKFLSRIMYCSSCNKPIIDDDVSETAPIRDASE